MAFIHISFFAIMIVSIHSVLSHRAGQQWQSAVRCTGWLAATVLVLQELSATKECVAAGYAIQRRYRTFVHRV